MRETILAVLALSIVTTMSLGVLSASIQNSIVQVDRELEIYANAVGAQILDYISSRSYDERSTPHFWRTLGDVANDDSTQWTTSTNFGTSPNPMCNLYEPYEDTVICDDVSDVHMDTLWQAVDYFVDLDEDGDSLTVPFEINAQVFYSDISNPDSLLSSGVLTHTKRVVLKVRSVQHRLDNRHGGVVTLQRLISFDQSAADERAFAAVEICDGVTKYVDHSLADIYFSNGATLGACP